MSGPSASDFRSLRILFGQPETRLAVEQDACVLSLKVPHLGGPASEEILSRGTLLQPASATCALLSDERWLAGALLQPVSQSLDTATLQLYRHLLEAAHGWSICRIWNYVPHINSERTGLENYRRFNLGRWQAYRDVYGEALHERLPAASAVGMDDDILATIFLACRQPVTAIENPHQVPAWRYPAAYGPKAPSFARAAVAGLNGSRCAWISGTAAIRGHESIAPGDPLQQLEVTLQNLRIMMEETGLPAGSVHSKIYLRNPLHFEAIAGRVAREPLLQGLGGPVFLQAEICRRELEVEIEVSSPLPG